MERPSLPRVRSSIRQIITPGPKPPVVVQRVRSRVPTPEPVTNAGKVYGYVSATLSEEDRARERAILKAAGCLIVVSELDALLEDMSAGDVLMTVRLGSLAKSTVALRDAVHKVDAKGITLKVVQPPIDTSTANGKVFIGMLNVFADFEADIRKGRSSFGASKSKIDPIKVRELQQKGLGPTEIARELEVSRASIYRLLK